MKPLGTAHATATGVDHDTALALVERAREVCPYSHAVRGNVDVDPRVA